MKKQHMIIGLTVAGFVALAVMLHTFTSSTVAARPVSLVITAPDGQHFTGIYAADGVTNAVSAIAPATIRMKARDVVYEFKRGEGGHDEFRVALFVGDLCRTSTTSGQRQGVRGALRYAAGKESYWAAGF
jgi:hypothetical protein